MINKIRRKNSVKLDKNLNFVNSELKMSVLVYALFFYKSFKTITKANDENTDLILRFIVTCTQDISVDMSQSGSLDGKF